MSKILPQVERAGACDVSQNADGTYHVVFLNGPQADYPNRERTFEALVVVFGTDPVKANEVLQVLEGDA